MGIDALEVASLLSQIEILPMSMVNLPEVMDIERLCFPSPWSKSSFEEVLTREYSHAYVIKGMHQGKYRVIGYICFWMFLDEMHILNLAIHPKFQRQGLGYNLLQYSLNLAEKRGIHWATLEVRKSNYVAISLYKKVGFKPVRIRHNYYLDNREDAVVMEKIIGKKGGDTHGS
ncbi:MAG TPA: ribosomal-protein-alanine N-acetyltransferase [Syntrophaceae bacterium]|nr:ribosomal-protein-alanine N-acetyltransferase [Syntrophaceae bacterium]